MAIESGSIGVIVDRNEYDFLSGNRFPGMETWPKWWKCNPKQWSSYSCAKQDSPTSEVLLWNIDRAGWETLDRCLHYRLGNPESLPESARAACESLITPKPTPPQPAPLPEYAAKYWRCVQGKRTEKRNYLIEWDDILYLFQPAGETRVYSCARGGQRSVWSTSLDTAAVANHVRCGALVESTERECRGLELETLPEYARLAVEACEAWCNESGPTFLMHMGKYKSARDAAKGVV
jgi:hypothetical protein